jgi:5,10-methylenetetrahydromethanopterin reductase
MLSDELRPRDLIELVELTDSLGYGTFWYTDQRFWRDCYAGLTLAAVHSRHLKLGPGVSDPYTRHPAGIAMAIATIDEISDGRAMLGLGVGGSGIKQMQLPKERPVRALREAIELIRLMLAGGKVGYHGELYQLVDGSLGFAPVNRQIPIYVASHSPQVLRLTGQLADGVLLGNMARASAVDEAAAHVRQGEQHAGRGAGAASIHLRLEACISDDEQAALKAMKRRFAARLLASYPRWEYLERLGVVPGEALQAAAAAGAVPAMAEALSDADVRTTALVGDADAAAQQLAGLLTPDVAGVTIRPYACEGQGLDVTIQCFAERVWPRVTAAHTRAAASVPPLQVAP